MPQPHPIDDQLEFYALDRLSSAEVIQIEEHLIVCGDCRERLEQTSAFAWSLREALKQHPLPALRHENGWLERLRESWDGFSWRPGLAMAGALAVIVFAATIYWSGLNRTGSGMTLAPVASLQLTAMRGEMPSVHAARELDLVLTDASPAGTPSASGRLRVEIVSDSGAPVWAGAPSPSDGSVAVKITHLLAPGVYFARLLDASGKLLHEYGFRVAE